jgi:methionine biosynthesis protein MetW
MRFDLKIIASLVEQGSRVLDLGCGRGDLLHHLRDRKQVSVNGIEINEKKVIKAIARGIPVLHGDLSRETQDYPDRSFDCVILSQTLQQVLNPEEVIKEMLRIGGVGIVSFPCFSHISIKLQLLLTSRAPVTRDLPFEWYDTPNIRVITLKDFRIFCARNRIKILKEIAVTGGRDANSGRIVRHFPDWLARYGIFLIAGKSR